MSCAHKDSTAPCYECIGARVTQVMRICPRYTAVSSSSSSVPFSTGPIPIYDPVLFPPQLPPVPEHARPLFWFYDEIVERARAGMERRGVPKRYRENYIPGLMDFQGSNGALRLLPAGGRGWLEFTAMARLHGWWRMHLLGYYYRKRGLAAVKQIRALLDDRTLYTTGIGERTKRLMTLFNEELAQEIANYEERYHPTHADPLTKKTQLGTPLPPSHTGEYQLPVVPQSYRALLAAYPDADEPTDVTDVDDLTDVTDVDEPTDVTQPMEQRISVYWRK